MQKFLRRWAMLFVGLFALTLPLERGSLLGLGFYFLPLTTGFAQWLSGWWLGQWADQPMSLSSDSPGLVAHAVGLALLSAVGAAVWLSFSRHQDEPKIRYWLSVLCRYVLALALLRYGAVKIFPIQFFTPDPNTLFTPFGMLDRDILYWSIVGLSRPYQIFLGSVELLAALLLFFRPTYLIGACLATGIMANVLAVNLAFGISVRLFSAYLLLLALLLLLPQMSAFYRFFILQQPAAPEQLGIVYPRPILTRLQAGLKGLLLMLCLLDVAGLIMRYQLAVAANPFADSVGAYRLAASSSDIPAQWRRVFIHRSGYLIVQDERDQFTDYRLQPYSGSVLLISDWLGQGKIKLSIHQRDDGWWMQTEDGQHWLRLERINLQNLPALSRSLPN